MEFAIIDPCANEEYIFTAYIMPTCGFTVGGVATPGFDPRSLSRLLDSFRCLPGRQFRYDGSHTLEYQL